MRVAFVGKGGSGKTTVATAFIMHLIKNDMPVLAIDADINVHLKEILIHKHPQEKQISLPDNAYNIKQYLKGKNKRITTPDHMVKSTPPAKGSNFIIFDDENYVLKNFASKINNKTHLLEVGTYEAQGIGTSCYHTNLAIVENILTHTLDTPQQWVIVDMVAGTDAFSNTLHNQFDVLVFVVEPNPESITTCERYLALAKAAKVENRMIIIANKVDDDEDEKYLHKQGIKPLCIIPTTSAIKKSRQQQTNDALAHKLIQDKMIVLHKKISEQYINRNIILKAQHELHKKYIAQDYITSALGDISHQIDKEFSYHDHY